MPDEPFPTGHVGTRVSKLSLLPKASRAGKRILGENHPVGPDCSRPPNPCLRDTVPGRARSDSVSVRDWGGLNRPWEVPRSHAISAIATVWRRRSSHSFLRRRLKESPLWRLPGVEREWALVPHTRLDLCRLVTDCSGPPDGTPSQFRTISARNRINWGVAADPLVGGIGVWWNCPAGRWSIHSGR